MAEDRGAAGVLLVFLLGLGLLILSGAAGVAHMAQMRARLSAAADLGALAAAREADCATAVRIAETNGAAAVECHADGGDYTVVTSGSIRVFGASMTLRARARAGPP